jgi:hypothetical protein
LGTGLDLFFIGSAAATVMKGQFRTHYSYYSPASESGIIWNDPSLNIPWPVVPNEAILSDKDRQLGATGRSAASNCARASSRSSADPIAAAPAAPPVAW